MALAPHHKRSGGGGLECRTTCFTREKNLSPSDKMETNGVLVATKTNTHTHTHTHNPYKSPSDK